MHTAPLVIRHEGIIVKLVTRYYRLLPAHVKASYGLDDMVGDVTLQVLRRQHKFSAARSSATGSTFVWRVAENYCRTLVNRHQWACRRTAGMVPVEDLRNLASQDNQRRIRESRQAVERMIEFASEELREALSDILTVHRATLHQHLRKEQLQQEVQLLAKRHRVRGDDFRMVLAHLV